MALLFFDERSPRRRRRPRYVCVGARVSGPHAKRDERSAGLCDDSTSSISTVTRSRLDPRDTPNQFGHTGQALIVDPAVAAVDAADEQKGIAGQRVIGRERSRIGRRGRLGIPDGRVSVSLAELQLPR